MRVGTPWERQLKKIKTEGVPLLVWGEQFDEATLEQARHLARLPFAFRHVALMPDAHVGYGMPIGGVLAAEGQIIPNAVGLDIGCGMRAWKTNITAEEMAIERDAILADIQRSVPQGFHWHDASQADLTGICEQAPDIPALQAEIAKAERQVGTLGGGNHFIELQVDSAGVVWVMIHTGSRNVGKQMAEYYNRVARDENRRTASEVPPEWGLAHLAIDAEPGAEYFAVMTWCLRFARENRRLIAEAVQKVISRRLSAVEPGPSLDVHHNYASLEEHFGTPVVVHRKGAVRAEGEVIVPGSMGTASYIAEGSANVQSFESCSHGAGRAMGRKAAVRALPRERVLEELERRGVRVVSADRRGIAEEAPAAYKDIEEVMGWQGDLVTPRIRLVPIGVVKG